MHSPQSYPPHTRSSCCLLFVSQRGGLRQARHCASPSCCRACTYPTVWVFGARFLRRLSKYLAVERNIRSRVELPSKMLPCKFVRTIAHTEPQVPVDCDCAQTLCESFR